MRIRYSRHVSVCDAFMVQCSTFCVCRLLAHDNSPPAYIFQTHLPMLIASDVCGCGASTSCVSTSSSGTFCVNGENILVRDNSNCPII